MRILLEIAYRGQDFQGWQSQAHGQSVQDVLERALATVCGQPLRLHGAGRTDAGVHALGQRAHFDAPEPLRFPPEEWPRPLNGHLPPTVRVLSSQAVAPDFHARFSALGKEYHYLLQTGRILHPLLLGRAAHYPSLLDPDLLRTTWALFAGHHDFKSFAGRANPPPRSTWRTLHHLEIHSQGPLHRFIVRGEGFLFRMVRCMVGATIRVAAGKEKPETLQRALAGADFPAYAAPAEGLYLVKVFYPPEQVQESSMEHGIAWPGFPI